MARPGLAASAIMDSAQATSAPERSRTSSQPACIAEGSAEPGEASNLRPYEVIGPRVRVVVQGLQPLEQGMQGALPGVRPALAVEFRQAAKNLLSTAVSQAMKSPSMCSSVIGR